MDDNSINNQNFNNQTNTDNNTLNNNGLLTPKPIPKLRTEQKQYSSVIPTNKNVDSNNTKSQAELSNNNNDNNKLTEFKPYVLNITNTTQDNNLVNNVNNQNNSNIQTNGYLSQYINEEKNKQSNNLSPLTNQEYDKDLIISFMGLNYDKLINSKFSWSTFFFGYIYFLYRKMFIYGIILYVVELILLFTNLFIFSFLLRLLLAVLFPQIYSNFVGNKIKMIITNNPNKTKDELKQICSKTGDTSILMVVLGYVVAIVISGIMLLLTLMLGIGTIFTELLSDLKIEVDKSGNATEFNGIYMFDDSKKVIDEVFELEIPGEYSNDSSNSHDYRYVTGPEVFDSCRFRFSLIDNYVSAKTFSEQMAIYYNGYNSVEDKKINNIYWKTFTTQDEMNTSYYYVVNIEDKVYLALYQIGYDVEKGICDTHHKSIISSIKRK